MTPLSMSGFGMADIDRRVTCPLCTRDRRGQRFCRDRDMSHVEQQFCDVTTMPVIKIVFSKPIVTSQRLVRELIIR